MSQKFKCDYLIVGCGLYGATFAHFAKKAGKSVIVIDKRDHVGGNVYTETVDDITVHKYGAHIFHTSNKEVWDFVNEFAEFNDFVNSPLANYKGEIYNLPFNMNTFKKLWGVTTSKQAKAAIKKQSEKYKDLPPVNVENKALSVFGDDIYVKLIKGYTQKQWGRDCKNLPASIIDRLPFRFTYDNNYFTDKYQGVPIGGYTALVEKMLSGITVITGVNYFDFIRENSVDAAKVVFSGSIDEYYGYRFGTLQYRTVRYEIKTLDVSDFQGVAVVNYTDENTPFTRIVEHKHFEFGNQPKTVLSYEYFDEWAVGKQRFYPITDEYNLNLYLKYKSLAERENKVIFGGRLGKYKYFDMDDVILDAFDDLKNEGLK